MSLITNPIAPIIKNPIEHCLAILTNSININQLVNFFLPFLSGFSQFSMKFLELLKNFPNSVMKPFSLLSDILMNYFNYFLYIIIFINICVQINYYKIIIIIFIF